MSPGPGGDEVFARNLIGGRWQFPAVPFEYEVRSPLTGSVVATVPLSSRIDVARAVRAATAAAPPWASDPGRRSQLLRTLIDKLRCHADWLAELQADEAGLELADSQAAVHDVIERSPGLIGQPACGPGVTGCVLSWGLPLTEVAEAVLPGLGAGRTAVIKPSLRAPLSAAAFAGLAISARLPPGVVNLVQGTGVDAGAALLSSPGLAALHVRASGRTLAQAARAAAQTGAELTVVRNGGGALIAAADADPDQVATAITATLALHSAGGMAYLPMLCAPEAKADAITEAVAARLPGIHPAPLPSEPLRQRALARISQLRQAGARLIAGGVVPDDARHRMGWIIPPTLLDLGDLATPASAAALASEPIGPVLTIATWRAAEDLAATLDLPSGWRPGSAGINCIFRVSS